jgi:hypothetical protein
MAGVRVEFVRGYGKVATVYPVILTNEGHDSVPGDFNITTQTNRRYISAPKWGGIEGVLLRGGNVLVWSNKTWWSRHHEETVVWRGCAGPGAGEGHPKMTFTPRGIVAENERAGDKPTAITLAEGNEVIATDWTDRDGRPVHGRIQKNGAISWPEGREWYP